jgi:ATP-dependent RNA helicase DDX18/HAS1
VTEFEFPANKIVNVQSQIEKLINQNYYLNKSAKEVGRSCSDKDTVDCDG